MNEITKIILPKYKDAYRLLLQTKNGQYYVTKDLVVSFSIETDYIKPLSEVIAFIHKHFQCELELMQYHELSFYICKSYQNLSIQ
jgi:hypothetical protein